MNKTLKKLSKLLLLLNIVFPTISMAQDVWSKQNEAEIPKSGTRYITPKAYRTVKLQLNSLRDILSKAPMEYTDLAKSSVNLLSLPLPDGRMVNFDIEESPMMEPGLAEKFPEIKTYSGVAVNDPGMSVRFDLTPQGFHAMVLIAGGSTVFIDPYQFGGGDIEHYIVYNRDNYASSVSKTFQCLVKDGEQNNGYANRVSFGTCELRTYRLALAATGEYTTFHGGTVLLAQAAQVTTMNRVNGVFMRDMAVKMNIIANNNLIIYTNSGSDPYTNNDADAMLGENQTNVDAVIGDANYDLGHVFATSFGGVVAGSPCSSGDKASGVTGLPNPIGDPFDIDFVTHEFGHQFGCPHTYNSNSNGCNGQRSNANAYEPGSGVTIMAYAGLCFPDNAANNSIDHFHGGSLTKMSNFVTGFGNTCANKTALTNSAPTLVTPGIGVTYNIPQGTMFFLSATATDPDANTLTYCWETMNNGIPTAHPPATTETAASMFRSWSPTTSGTRYFPRLSDVIAGTVSPYEVLPTVARSMLFRCTVRDNAAGGGCSIAEDVTVEVASSGPFVLTVPSNTGLSYTGNTNQTVTWNVAGTTAAPVSCANVDILLSTDGGLTYPTVLISNTPNDGTESVIIPNTPSTTARMMVVASGGNFYDISNNNFTITVGASATADFSGTPTTVCTGQTVTFTDASTSATSWSWDFGANATPATANTQGPHTVTYSTAGTKTVSLSINSGVDVETKTNYITVNTVVPTVSISANPGTTITTGSSVTFTATPTNGGTPTYQWKKNGTNISGQTSATYTATAGTDFVSTDDITCEMTSTAACASPTLVTSNTLTMNVVVPSAAALKFDGTNDVVKCGNDISLQNNEGTLEAWFRTPNAGPSYRTIVMKQHAVAIQMVDNQLIAYDWNGGAFLEIHTGIFPNDNLWHHAAITYVNGGELRVYYDGALVATRAGFSIMDQTHNVTIGDNDDGGQNFPGEIDEVRIWNRILCQSEIVANMNCEIPTTAPNLVGNYHLNQGVPSGNNTGFTNVIDASGTGNHGTMVNFARTGTTSNWISPGAVVSGSSCSPITLFEINVTGNGNSIVDGDNTPSTTDHTDFANINVTSGTLTRTFTVQNTGLDAGSLSISSIALSGTNASDFSLTALSPASPIAAGSSATFTVTFNPSALGVRTATITINSNDCSETAYNFDIQGTGTNAALGYAVNEGNTGTNDYANAIAKDGTGNYYVGGTKGTLGFITKYDAVGSAIWTKNYGSSVNGIVINNAGNAVITGGFGSTTSFGGLTYSPLSSFGSTDAYVANLDVNGDVTNAVKIGGSSIDLGSAIAKDTVGNIYVAGEFNSTVDFDPSANIVSRMSSGARDVFVVKYDQSLGFQWVYTIGGTSQDRAYGIAVGDHVYITGQFHGAMSGLTSAGTYDGFVMKLSKTSGGRMWEQSFGSTGAEDKGNAIALDASNNVYIAGAFSGSVLGLTGNGSSVDALIYSVDALGNFRWSKKGGAGGKDIAYGISVNGNEVLTTGYVRSAGSFTGSGYLNGTAGTNDVFVVKYLTDGTFACYRLMSGAGDQEGRAIWAGAGTFAMVGINNGTFGAELDNTTTIPLTTTGLFDVFVMEGQTCTSGSMKLARTIEETNSTVSVYPNPNNGQFTVKGTGTLQVSIINMNGIVVSEQKSENEMLIDLKNEVSGIYLVKIQTEQEEKFFRVQVIK